MNNQSDSHNDHSWHLDKRVPLAMIFAIIMQTGGAAWVAGQIVNRVDFLERDVERQRVVLERHSGSINALNQSLSRQDEKLSSILRILEDMKNDFDDFKTEQKELLEKIPR